MGVYIIKKPDHYGLALDRLKNYVAVRIQAWEYPKEYYRQALVIPSPIPLI